MFRRFFTYYPIPKIALSLFLGFLPKITAEPSPSPASATGTMQSLTPSASPELISNHQVATITNSPSNSPTKSSLQSSTPQNQYQTLVMQTPQRPADQPGERSSYSSIRVDGPYIAMTFDDGPDAKLTPRLLDILKERKIHATFFVLGQRVQEHPEILVRAVSEGHQIGNHSWDHPPLNKLAEGGLRHQLADTSDLIKQTIGKAPVIMRPPYGATSPRLSRAIEKEYGMKVILWSVDPFDWKNPGSKVVSERILSGWKGSSGVKPGAIILSHDIHKGTIEAMPATLDALLAKGYKFVTMDELLALEIKNPAPTPASPSASSSPSTHKAKRSKGKASQ
jgi:peptidoglycan/xylan/chitin deacetylase (PgdA/CDA1 family)